MINQETGRFLKEVGKVYVSVPSRFSWHDTHFHLMFLNWMPRRISHRVIGILGKHKDYTLNNGKQRIDEMYYATYTSFKNKASKYDLFAEDIRLNKIKNKVFFANNFFNIIPVFLFKTVYLIVRPFYFKTFHFLLTKKSN